MNSDRIRELNDRLRQYGVGGRILITSGIVAIGLEFVAEVLAAVRAFAEFSVDNDPLGEHDFGGFTVKERRLFWKIDYYAPDMQGHSMDPSNPDATARVLTIMLAEEY